MFSCFPVYGNVPVTTTEAAKLEPKKVPTFVKPRVSQLDENRLQAKVSPSHFFTRHAALEC